MPVDHGQSVAHGGLQILIVHEHDQQVHHADLLGVGSCHGRMEGERFAGANARNALVHKNAIFPDGLNHRGIGI